MHVQYSSQHKIGKTWENVHWKPFLTLLQKAYLLFDFCQSLILRFLELLKKMYRLDVQRKQGKNLAWCDSKIFLYWAWNFPCSFWCSTKVSQIFKDIGSIFFVSLYFNKKEIHVKFSEILEKFYPLTDTFINKKRSPHLHTHSLDGMKNKGKLK